MLTDCNKIFYRALPGQTFIKLIALPGNMVIGKRLLLIVLVLISLLPLAAAEETDCLVYFYGTNCAGCAPANQHLDSLKAKYPTLEIKKFEVYYNRDKARMLENYFNSYRVPENSRGLPVLFLPGSYFVGSSTLVSLLEGRILDNLDNSCPTIEGETAIGLIGEKEPYGVLDTLTLSMVTKAAFKDVFRPGMIALLLVLLMILSSFRKKENILQRGILAVLTLALASILFGLGLLFKAPVWISKAIGIFVIIASIIRIKGFFATWKVVFEDLSESAEKNIINYIRYLFTPVGVVILSFILTVFSTGRVSELLTLLRVLSLDGIYNPKLFGYLFYHTLIILILPVAMIIILYRTADRLDRHASGKEPYNDPKAEKWRSHTQKVLRFVVSSLM